jgi:hypothetical protein
MSVFRYSKYEQKQIFNVIDRKINHGTKTIF